MIFIIHRLDEAGKSAERSLHRDSHLEYLREHAAQIIAAGPYLDPGTGADRGSMFMIRCPDLAQARRFAEEDPFAKAGIFKEVQVWQWTKRLGSLDIPSCTGS
jgi:uncharacterized protein YciI